MNLSNSTSALTAPLVGSNLITFRPFLNTDPPRIVEIWNSQQRFRGRAAALTTTVLEDLVLSKPYFDRQGFITAVEADRPIGFVHAAFGPDASGSTLATEHGVICRVMVEPRDDQQELRKRLLDIGETYLREHGCKTIHAGGFAPNDPFYLGLYGGSRLPGILSEDRSTIALYTAAGYQNIQRQIIMQCQLTNFRPRIDRQQMMIRRKYQIAATFDPKARNWWEACTLGYTDRTKFELFGRDDGQSYGEVTFWDMVPLSHGWGGNATGIFDLHIAPGQRRSGLATFLICESIRQLLEHSVTLAEVQTSIDDKPTIALFERLGFSKVDEGFVLVKQIV